MSSILNNLNAASATLTAQADDAATALPTARRLYSKREVAHLLGITESTLDKLIALGTFPRGIKATRQSEPQWSGAVLAAWLFLAPMMVPGSIDD